MITDSIHLCEANKEAAAQKSGGGRAGCVVNAPGGIEVLPFSKRFLYAKKTAVPVPHITELAATVFLCFINLQERFSAFCSFL